MQEAIQLLIDNKVSEDDISDMKENNPFIAIVGIIDAATTFVTIVLGTYLSAGVINALSDNFGVQKDFNRAFTLIAYSCTPLCIGGLLYAYPPLSSIAPYIGLYGFYLLYAGIKPVINPPVAKASNCFIIGVAVMLAAYFFIPKIVQPVAVDIKMKVLTEQVREMAKKNNGNFNEKYFPRYLKESMKDFNEKDFQRYLNEHMKDLR